MELTKILYTGEATVTGGREGQVRSSDGRLELDLARLTEMGGSGGEGTNPEQIFAGGYAACFRSALYRVAGGRRDPKPDLSDSRLTARAGIGPNGRGGFGLAVTLDLHPPRVAREGKSTVTARRLPAASILYLVLCCSGCYLCLERKFHGYVCCSARSKPPFAVRAGPVRCLELQLEGELDRARPADLMKGVLPSKDASAAQARPQHRNGLSEVG